MMLLMLNIKKYKILEGLKSAYPRLQFGTCAALVQGWNNYE